MKVIVAHAAKDLRVETRETPSPGPGQVLVKMAAGGICGSDLHYYNHGGFGAIKLREPLTKNWCSSAELETIENQFGFDGSGSTQWTGSLRRELARWLRYMTCVAQTQHTFAAGICWQFNYWGDLIESLLGRRLKIIAVEGSLPTQPEFQYADRSRQEFLERTHCPVKVVRLQEADPTHNELEKSITDFTQWDRKISSEACYPVASATSD